MKFLKVFLLILLFIFLFLYSFVFMAFLSLERTVLNIEHYKSVSEEYNIFEDLHSNLGSMFFEGDEAEFLLEAFDASWLEDNFFLILEDVLAYTAGEQDDFTASIDLTDAEEAIKENMIGEIMEMEGMSRAEAEIFFEEDVDLGDEFLTEFSLADEIDEETKIMFTTISNVRQYFPIISYVVLGLTLLFMCLLSNFAGGFKWFGTGMFISGFLMTISLLGFNFSLSPTMLTSFFNMPMAFDFVTALLRATLFSMVVVPIVYGIIGLLLIIFGCVWSRARKKKSKPTEEASLEVEAGVKKSEKLT